MDKEKTAVLSVNMAFHDKLNKTLDLIKELDLNYPVVLDRDGKVTEQFYFPFTPATFFIDEEGIVRNMIQGIIGKDYLLEEIERTRQY
jgi:peroxiredoxin